MLKKQIQEILDRSVAQGWVLEPDAKTILGVSGIPVPRFKLIRTKNEALAFADQLGYPVVAKIVSPDVVHKSEVGGVKAGIQIAAELQAVFRKFARHETFAGMLVEEMVAGLELIVGAKIDRQFGPIVLLGMGGTGVEIYKDSALRMAPITEKDVHSMIHSLKARELVHGFRGSPGIDIKSLIDLMMAFSKLLIKMGDQITSMDLNPVICSAKGCTVADARIMIDTGGTT